MAKTALVAFCAGSGPDVRTCPGRAFKTPLKAISQMTSSRLKGGGFKNRQVSRLFEQQPLPTRFV